MAKFDSAFEQVLAHEGGYSNDPDDPGGETYRGIARKMQPDWLGWQIIDLIKKQSGFPDSLSALHDVEIDRQLQYEVKTFYYQNFWMKLSGDKLNSQQVAASIFDFAVNAGMVVSISLAQKVAGAKTDGVMGPKTLEAINQFNPDHFLAAFAVDKISRYVDICKKRPASKKYFFRLGSPVLKPRNMNTFFASVWKFLALIFAGFAAGLITAIKWLEKPSVMTVNTPSFVAEQTQKIGKLKQRGEGNSQEIPAPVTIQSRKERRLARKAARRELRHEKELKKQDTELNGS